MVAVIVLRMTVVVIVSWMISVVMLVGHASVMDALRRGLRRASVPAAVGAGLGLERRFHRGGRRAQPAQHVLEHMVGGDAQKPIADLHRHVAVAQVIGGAPAGPAAWRR